MRGKMYFISDLHKSNFNNLLTIYLIAKKDSEYRSAMYLLSLPTIYNKVVNDKAFNDNCPFYWTEEYIYTDNDIEFLDKPSESYLTLSSGYKCIVDLALHLFNSSNPFNLCNALKTWDNTLYNVFKQAVEIRVGRD